MQLLILIGISLFIGSLCYTGIKFTKLLSYSEDRFPSSFPEEENEPIDVEFETTKH